PVSARLSGDAEALDQAPACGGAGIALGEGAGLAAMARDAGGCRGAAANSAVSIAESRRVAVLRCRTLGAAAIGEGASRAVRSDNRLSRVAAGGVAHRSQVFRSTLRRAGDRAHAGRCAILFER